MATASPDLAASRPRVPGRRTGTLPAWPRPALGVGLVALAIAFGTCLVAVGYAAAREGRAWAAIPYWVGSVTAFLATAAAMLSPKLSARERVLILVLQAAQQSLLRWMYSPLAFTFPDELQHWRTATDILATGHLYHANPLLAVSPVFPGLEELATALSSLTGGGLFAAGLIVSAACHIALAVALFVLYRRVTGDARAAGIAALLFQLTPLHAGFDTMFVYSAPALIFFACLLALAISEGGFGLAAWSAATLCLAALIVTHHLTAVVAIVVLGVLGVLRLGIRGTGPPALRLLALCGVGCALAGAWIVVKASSAISYLGEPLGSVVEGLTHHGNVAGRAPFPRAAGGTLPMTALGVAATAGLIAASAVILWRGRATRAAPIKMSVICAFAYFGVLVVRLVAPNGGEWSGRLLTYVSLFTAAGATPFLMWALAQRRRLLAAAGLALVTCVFLGGLASGWPAPWERLPGTFRAAAFESGVDEHNTDAALWFRDHGGPDRRIACDFSSCSLLGAYAHADVVSDAGNLYYAPIADPAVRNTIRRRGIEYLFVDTRITRGLPINGTFFHLSTSHSAAQQAAVPERSVAKFRSGPGFDLVYDDGTVQIYDVRHAPFAR